MRMQPIALLDDSRARTAIDRWHELKQERSHHEQQWESIAKLIRPQRGQFSSADLTGRRFDQPLSSAPLVAQSNFASGLYGTLTNPANRWLSMSLSDPDLTNHHSVREWTDLVSDRVLASFRPSVSSFYSSTIQIFSDLAAFGNGAQYDEVRRSEQKILDVTLSLAEVVVSIDAFGRVVEVVRKFHLTPRAIVDMFGAAPARVHDMAAKGATTKVACFHHVFKNMDWQKGRLGPKGKRWSSIYAIEEGRAVLRERGYAEMPFHFPRWEVESGQGYGTGPGFNALASARVHYRMKEANMRAGQRAADPPLLAPDRNAWQLNGIVRPGHVIYNGMSVGGQQLVRPLDLARQTGLTLEMQQAELEEIRDAFHFSLMNLAGRTGMTATEVIERAEEKLRLMAPHMGRIQEEYLAPKIARRFSLLWRAGQIPPPPPEAEGQALEVRYVSAASMAQKSTEGAAVVRILQDVSPLMETDPRYLDRIDPDAVLEVLAEARGTPARILRSRDEADALAAQRAQAQQAQQAMEMGQQGTEMLRNLAQAGGAGPGGEPAP